MIAHVKHVFIGEPTGEENWSHRLPSR
jgi:hypothetical protein